VAPGHVGYTERMSTTVTDNEDLQRFEIYDDGELAGFTDYHQAGDVMIFRHTEIDDRFRGRGLATELIRSALDDVRTRGFAVRPVCPLVRRFIVEHEDYHDLVRSADRAQLGI
jgi:uncharacterized protein